MPITHWSWRNLAGVIWIASVFACADRPELDPVTHRADVDAWRGYRYDLLHEEGWLLLTGLHWLEPGANTLGGAEDNDVTLAGADVPEHIGVLTVADTQVALTVFDGIPVRHDGKTITRIDMEPGSLARSTVVTLGTLYWHVIGRGGRYAVRVRDSLAPSFLAFDSVPMFPLNADWRFDARFERYDPPKVIEVPNILGTVNESPSPGAVVFSIGLKRYRLDVLGEPSDSTFWIQFGDSSNGVETYGGGRYIWVDAPREGRTIVDFNKSYNPPCVFTAYATCPLPPRQNKLSIRIDAGELRYPGS